MLTLFIYEIKTYYLLIEKQLLSQKSYGINLYT